MALTRVLEAEAMDTEEEARDYDAMDHGQVNARFCDDLLAESAELGRVLDVGTGTALIPIELCHRDPRVAVEAIDLAEHMLALARRNVARAALGGRIRVARADAKSAPWPAESFDTVMSNTLVHHIPEPRAVLTEAWRLVRRGGLLFVRDLERPGDGARVAELVETYAPISGAEPEVHAMQKRQRTLFEASLRAALTVSEVRAMIAPLGVPAGAVRATSDRHWTLSYVKP